MRLFTKMAGRQRTAGSSAYSYSYDTGVKHPSLSISIWLILFLSLCGVVATGYFKEAAVKKSHSAVYQSADQSQSTPQPAQVADTKDTVPARILSAPELETQIENWGEANSGQKWGVAVDQLTQGSVNVNYRVESSFHPAGLDTLLMDQSLIDGYAFNTWSQPLGASGSSISDCVSKMIKDSDDKCTTAVGNLVGLQNVNYQLKKAGLTSTDIANYSVSKRHTTAGDVDMYLNKFYESSTKPDAKQFILNLMNQQSNRDGIPAGSQGCKVYDKAGSYSDYHSDAGVVVCPKTTYSLVILSEGGSYDQIADLAKIVNKFFTN